MGDGEETRCGPGRSTIRAVAFGVSLLLVLAAVLASTGLVVHTARGHDPGNGAFAVLFAVLSAKAALSWVLWLRESEAVRPREDRAR